MARRIANPTTARELVDEINRLIPLARDAHGAKRKTYVSMLLTYGARLAERKDALWNEQMQSGRLEDGWAYLENQEQPDPTHEDLWLDLLNTYQGCCDALTAAQEVLCRS